MNWENTRFAVRFAVYHEDTLQLLGSLDAGVAKSISGPLSDSKAFEIKASRLGFARAEFIGGAVAEYRYVRFQPLSLKRDSNRTFILFVDCHPEELERVPGFKYIE